VYSRLREGGDDVSGSSRLGSGLALSEQMMSAIEPLMSANEPANESALGRSESGQILIWSEPA